jgi:hypothetical protein
LAPEMSEEIADRALHCSAESGLTAVVLLIVSLACRLASICAPALFRIPPPALSLFRVRIPRELSIKFDSLIVVSFEKSNLDRTWKLMGIGLGDSLVIGARTMDGERRKTRNVQKSVQ